ncbi:preprotein translocase subunit TatA [Phyllobacterium phragmitis]|uniref:Protein MgtC n=1 Tax=Phyllobacterium phragmitis TaxID=2670329 RepID=A0A2S9ITD5_9HYPH|nr:MgtC/SapB family protein [Phyllobacterium phragmitis]PRD43792.1 preprotein translocase subunit TatA [Phyllobacterium phragmitis]
MENILTDIAADMLPDTAIPYHVILARICGALILVSMIGIDRETRNRPAGLRTHLLVGLAAAVFGILAGEITRAPLYQIEQVRIDPLRVVEAVTAGVAFLAAGLIVFGKGQVHGLTTGAGMWLAAAIGLSTGYGFWIIGFFATAAGAVVLRLLYRVERLLEWK